MAQLPLKKCHICRQKRHLLVKCPMCNKSVCGICAENHHNEAMGKDRATGE